MNDKILALATGKSRWEKNWRNVEVTWGDLLKKLSKTHYTAETHSEYMRSTKKRQSEIKDIGGFVGGYLANGKRRKGSVTLRSVICLDLDYAEPEVFEDYKILLGYAACMYSTHKHTPDKPRLRLIIPLAETVTSDQYEPISRKIAEKIGIDQFDDTTYQPERLMYWPSTSKGAEYFFDSCDGELLNGADILAEYHDWTDISSWPLSSRVDKVLAKAMKKQENPLEKKGVVGAFCRTYSISEAIANFLSEEYTPCSIEDRYTYTRGSTAAGLVVYDDLFAFSHHGTDPASMQLCNAFDLVRLHKFGELDEDAREGTATTKLPSFSKMVDMAMNDKATKKVIVEERISSAAEDFAGVELEGILEQDWTGELECNQNDDVKSTIDNVMKILENDPNISEAVAYNEFEKKSAILHNLPWRKVNRSNNYFTDTDESGFRHYFEKMYGIAGAKKIEDGINLISKKNAFHPVKKYLDSLEWDNTKRLETLFIDYMGAQDSKYTRAVTRKALVACVARIMRPGCKFDNVLTLVGRQGCGKSTILAKLGGEWYNENVTLFNITKETADLIQGSWIIELGELVGFKKAEAETVKNFISRTEDKYRKAYGRNTDIFPRQCVFFGTTNESLFLRDPTGNRRWWPLEVGVADSQYSVFDDLSQEIVDQIWAEAKHLHDKGERLYISDEVYRTALTIQESHSEHNEKTGLIEKFLNEDIPKNWESMDIYLKREFLDRSGDDARWDDAELVRRDRVCVAALWVELFRGDLKYLRRAEQIEIMNCMRKIDGWDEKKNPLRFGEYGRQKGFVRRSKGGN